MPANWWEYFLADVRSGSAAPLKALAPLPDATKEEAERLLDTLEPPFRKVVEMRYGVNSSPTSFHNIGKETDTTAERAKQRLRTALSKLHQQYNS